MQITLKQARILLDAFDNDEETEITLSECDGFAGYGLYLHYTEYPEDGSIFLGDDTAEVNAQPPVSHLT